MSSQATSRPATTLGANIKRARLAAGLTQRQLADRVDVDPMMVSKWERGWHRPSEENLIALTRELGRDMAWLYTERAA
jgi:transcriptional regulator with XRE-family HTH domain